MYFAYKICSNVRGSLTMILFDLQFTGTFKITGLGDILVLHLGQTVARVSDLFQVVRFRHHSPTISSSSLTAPPCGAGRLVSPDSTTKN